MQKRTIDVYGIDYSHQSIMLRQLASLNQLTAGMKNIQPLSIRYQPRGSFLLFFPGSLNPNTQQTDTILQNDGEDTEEYKSFFSPLREEDLTKRITSWSTLSDTLNYVPSSHILVIGFDPSLENVSNTPAVYLHAYRPMHHPEITVVGDDRNKREKVLEIKQSYINWLNQFSPEFPFLLYDMVTSHNLMVHGVRELAISQ